jgi:hypothetical protein
MALCICGRAMPDLIVCKHICLAMPDLTCCMLHCTWHFIAHGTRTCVAVFGSIAKRCYHLALDQQLWAKKQDNGRLYGSMLMARLLTRLAMRWHHLALGFSWSMAACTNQWKCNQASMRLRSPNGQSHCSRTWLDWIRVVATSLRATSRKA